MKSTDKEKLLILLDENMPPRKTLLLNSRSNVNIRHILHDYGHEGLSDPEVLARATSEGRILFTADWDFKKARGIQKNKAVVRFPGNLEPKILNGLMIELFKKYKHQSDYFGKIILVSNKKLEILDSDGPRRTEKI